MESPFPYPPANPSRGSSQPRNMDSADLKEVQHNKFLRSLEKHVVCYTVINNYLLFRSRSIYISRDLYSVSKFYSAYLEKRSGDIYVS